MANEIGNFTVFDFDKLIGNLKEKELVRIMEVHKDHITSLTDLTGGEDPSWLFYILINACGRMLDPENTKDQTKMAIAIRRRLNPIIKKLGPSFLTNPQIIENRNFLMHPDADVIDEDSGIILPDEPVIWIANHSFKDDTLASILVVRHAYILFGSLPQFYNTFDGVTAFLNGVVQTNRKVKLSRGAAVPKSVGVLRNGADLFEFPEGVWNKTPDKLLLDFWPGVYRTVQETGFKVVPVIHYQRDKIGEKVPGNEIHTVIDAPVDITNMTEREGLEFLRDKLATWYWLMMEQYGQSSCYEEFGMKQFAERPEINAMAQQLGISLDGRLKTYSEVWEEHLRRRVATADRYDREIELSADYRPKYKPLPEDVFAAIADEEITDKNKDDVEYARQLIKTRKMNDYQRRF